MGGDQLARLGAGRHGREAVHPVGQHERARRHLEPVVIRLQPLGGRADHQPESTLPAVEDRALRLRIDVAGRDVGDGGVSAAEPAAGDFRHHGASARRGVPEAVLERRRRARRLRRGAERPPRQPAGAGLGRQPRPAAARRRSAAARSRRACRPSSGRPTTRTRTSCSSTSCTDARERPRGSRSSAA